MVSSGFQMHETFETMRPQAEWFYCFWVFGNLMKPEARVFEITFPQRKLFSNYIIIWISFDSQLKYYIRDVKYMSRHLTAALWQFLNIHQCHIVT